MTEFSHIPIIDISKPGAAEGIGQACRECGFFYVIGHGVPAELQQRLHELSREFFALPAEEKLRIPMSLGGRAWRGYFRVGDELTSGLPDQKEGLYFGTELPVEHPAVQAGTPLHGANLFPERPAGLRSAVLEYMDAMTNLGHRLMGLVAVSLELNEHYFREAFTHHPLTLFRIFSYPPPVDPSLWGVGEHTDYGLLTILMQDDSGGLEVKSRSAWVPAPPVPGSIVCNIGDMLDRMTHGLYKSTPHRVRNPQPRSRLSFPFFFDPDFFAPVHPIPLPEGMAKPDDAAERWDKASVRMFQGTYGDYLLGKVGKVFPGLKEEVL
jgi:isopenicillin N synthase-like dioxygenase